MNSEARTQTASEAQRERIKAILEDPASHAKWQSRPVREPKKKPSKPKADFNKRSADYMRERGYHAYRADYFDARMTRHHDFLEIFDFVCFGKGETVGLQITSASNAAAHRTKILAAKGFEWVKGAGWRVLLLTWNPKGEAKEEWL